MLNPPVLAKMPIIFEDGEALVIDKPAGLPVDPPRNGGTSLADYFEGLKLGFRRPPVAVHRIDTDTSGCLLLARNPKSAKRFGQAFQDRIVQKVYLGIIEGSLEDDSGTIDLAISKTSTAEEGWRMVPDQNGKPSVTHWRVINKQNGLSLIEFRPETGRTHQIRVHAQSGLGRPLFGDPVYGNPQNAAYPEARRTMLHASKLVMPRGSKPDIEVQSPLPPDFQALGFTDG